MKELISQVKSATKKRFLFGEKAVYELGTPNTLAGLSSIERKYDIRFPGDIEEFLLLLGCGSAGELYINHFEQIYPFDSNNGPIAGFVNFASDIHGNYFAFDPKSDNPSNIYYCCHDPAGYGLVSENIKELLWSIISNNFSTEYILDDIKLIKM